MKQLVILSGKGGTGKTTVAAALAHLLSQTQQLVLVDADVDAPNLGLIIDAPAGIDPAHDDTPTWADPFYGGKQATLDQSLCIGCGRCAEVCRFDAIVQANGSYAVETIACEGCAACYYACPSGAITMRDALSGYWFTRETRFGPLVQARLLPGEENSGKLVSRIRQEGLAVAAERNADWIVIDGSPGIGCPVIAAVTGADLALLVAEATVSGVHDLRRANEVVEHFQLGAAVCINKSDLNQELTDEIGRYCAERDVPVMARLPYDETVLEAMQAGVPVTELADNPVGRAMHEIAAALCPVTE